MSSVSDPELIDAARSAVIDELRSASKTILVTHEHPDGDALGSLVAMQHVLSAMGHDTLMFIAESDLPLPYEYRFLQLDGLVSQPPADLDERTSRVPGLRQHRAQSRR